jgi:hypothetical protein
VNVFSLAPYHPIVVVVALIYLAYIKAIYTQVMISDKLILDVARVPRYLKHLLKAVYCLFVVLCDAVAIAELMINVHLMLKFTQIVTDIF